MNITLDVSPELEGQLQQAARVQETDVTPLNFVMPFVYFLKGTDSIPFML